MRYSPRAQMRARFHPTLFVVAVLGLTSCGTEVVQGIGREAEAATGGVAGTGGTPPCASNLAERITTRTIDVGEEVVPSDEYRPVVVAPTLDGGTLLAWRAAAAEEIRVTRLDAIDTPTDTLPPFAGREVHALVAHEAGGAMVTVSADPDIANELYCPTDAGQNCSKMDLLRFDEAGAITWQTTLTEKVNVGTVGALFIYWYEHTARLVFAENTYAVYFRSTRSAVDPIDPSRVAFRAGDTFRFIDTAGARIGGGWDWGCSYSWAVRLAYDGLWGAACHGDAEPNAMRMAVLDPTALRGESTFSDDVPASRRALGGLVAGVGTFWLSHAVPDADGTMSVRLARFDDAGMLASDVPIPGLTGLDTTYPFRVYMARYGEGRFLLGYKANGLLQLAVVDEEGATLDGPLTIEAPIDQFSEFVAAPGGEVIWAHSAGGAGGLTLTRVRACGVPITR